MIILCIIIRDAQLFISHCPIPSDPGILYDNIHQNQEEKTNNPVVLSLYTIMYPLLLDLLF